MARHEPLLPNAGIVARREYRDRTRTPLFVVSTIVLMGLALVIALAPIAFRYVDRMTVTRIAVVTPEDGLATNALAILDQLLNTPPSGADADWTPPFEIDRADEAASMAALRDGDVDAVLVVDRRPSGQLEIAYRTDGLGDQGRAQLVSVAAFGLGVLDWNANRPAGDPFFNPIFRIEPVNVPTDAGEPVDPEVLASRSFLGIVFVVLIFITVVIYGMWVATGVAAEKSSRVMELMISAASPRQLLTGKVVGIGLAGLTQYLAIALPALGVLVLQDRIASALLGPTLASEAPLVGLTPTLLLAYGVFFLLGFTLFALIYASMGAFVSRPDDLQTLSLPLSLLAMGGYLAAIVALGGGGGGPMIRLLSFVPPFSPFVMLARIMTGRVAPWEVALSIGLLIAAIAVVAVVAVRLYAAGVLLYGQRPGFRAFVAAARRAG